VSLQSAQRVAVPRLADRCFAVVTRSENLLRITSGDFCLLLADVAAHRHNLYAPKSVKPDVHFKELTQERDTG
jgi:hypothetical protein